MSPENIRNSSTLYSPATLLPSDLNNLQQKALRLQRPSLSLGLLLGGHGVLGVLSVPVLGEVLVVRQRKHACVVKPRSAQRLSSPSRRFYSVQPAASRRTEPEECVACTSRLAFAALHFKRRLSRLEVALSSCLGLCGSLSLLLGFFLLQSTGLMRKSVSYIPRASGRRTMMLEVRKVVRMEPTLRGLDLAKAPLHPSTTLLVNLFQSSDFVHRIKRVLPVCARRICIVLQPSSQRQPLALAFAGPRLLTFFHSNQLGRAAPPPFPHYKRSNGPLPYSLSPQSEDNDE